MLFMSCSQCLPTSPSRSASISLLLRSSSQPGRKLLILLSCSVAIFKTREGSSSTYIAPIDFISNQNLVIPLTGPTRHFSHHHTRFKLPSAAEVEDASISSSLLDLCPGLHRSYKIAEVMACFSPLSRPLKYSFIMSFFHIVCSQ